MQCPLAHIFTACPHIFTACPHQAEFYERNPNLYGWIDSKLHRLDGFDVTVPVAFQPELGSVSTPVFESLRQWMGTEALAAFPKEGAGPEGSTDIHPIWAFHKYIPFSDFRSKYREDNTGAPHDFLYSYGTPTNASEYCEQAQIVQYQQFKALYEGFSEWMWVYYSGGKPMITPFRPLFT